MMFVYAFYVDGRTPVATISHADQQKLVNVLSRIKTNFATAENRAKQFKKATTEARKVGSEARIMAERAASAVALVENALKEAKNKSGSNGKHGKNQVEDRVDAVLSVIHLTAEKRRHQPSMKKDSKSPQLWEIPGISESLKESLRHKMQRRRLSIVLRPTRASMLAELGRMLKGESFQKQSISKRHDTELPPDLRAEQLLLLALHPTAPSPALPSVPPYSSSDMWAEPGWQVELDVPDDDPHRGVVLPFSSSAPFLQRQLSECNSVPGRQAASLIRPCQLRTLETPLSTVAQASAPAETHGISSKDIHPGKNIYRLIEMLILDVVGINLFLLVSLSDG
jgi:F0F1-type ATP synthase membrane subunit b/b'